MVLSSRYLSLLCLLAVPILASDKTDTSLPLWRNLLFACSEEWGPSIACLPHRSGLQGSEMSSRLVPRDAKQKLSNHSRTLNLADGDGPRAGPVSPRRVGANEEGLYGGGGSSRHARDRHLGHIHTVSSNLLCIVSSRDTPGHSLDDNCRTQPG